MLNETKKYNRSVANGLAWMAGSTTIWQLISWGMTIITARFLAPSDYGIMAMNDLLCPYLMTVSCLSLNNWLVQLKEVNKKIEETVLSVLLITGFISSFVAFFGASIIASYFREPKAEAVFQFCSVIYILRACQIIPESRLRRELSFKPIAIANVILGILRGILQVHLAWCGFGYWALAIGAIAREIGYLVILVTMAGFPKNFRWESQIAKESIKFGMSASTASMLWFVFSSADNLIVGRLFGTEILGFYAMAFYLSEMPLSKLNGVIAPVLTPYFSRIKNDTAALRTSFLKTNKTIISIIAPILFGLSITASPLVKLVFGSQWQGIVIPLQLLSIVGLLRAITSIGPSIIYALDKPKLVLQWTSINASILPLTFYVFGKFFGINGVYAAWFLVFPLSGIFTMLAIYKKIVDITYITFLKCISPGILSSLIMTICCYAIQVSMRNFTTDVVVELIAICSTGVVSYSIAYYVLFRESTNELLEQARSLRRSD